MGKKKVFSLKCCVSPAVLSFTLLCVATKAKQNKTETKRYLIALNFEVNSFLLRKKTHFPFSRLVFSVE
jgi:hypothetical protein